MRRSQIIAFSKTEKASDAYYRATSSYRQNCIKCAFHQTIICRAKPFQKVTFQRRAT